MQLDVHDTLLAVCRLPADEPVPSWVDLTARPLVSITGTANELSLVLPQRAVPPGVAAESGWRAMAVRGPLAFHLTGILASLSAAIAEAGVAIFVISTHDTDWLLVPHDGLAEACEALERAGHRVHHPALAPGPTARPHRSAPPPGPTGR